MLFRLGLRQQAYYDQNWHVDQKAQEAFMQVEGSEIIAEIPRNKEEGRCA